MASRALGLGVRLACCARMRALAIVGVAMTAVLAGSCMSGVPYCCALFGPARYDVGFAPASSRGASVVHVAGGMHSASAVDNQSTRGDIGVGYILDLRSEPTDPEKAVQSSSVARWVFGGYLEGAYRLGGGAHHRGFAGLRAEILRAYDNGPLETLTGVGLTARASWEVDRTVRSSNWRGAVATGVFVETTARTFSGGLTEYTVVTGVSFRHPMGIVPTRRTH